MCKDFPKALSQKLSFTLGPTVSSTLSVPVDWVVSLCAILPCVRQHTAMCVFKCLTGGWTTSHRMHEPDRLGCIFGCREQHDEIGHYFLCSPLWQIAGEALGVQAPLDLTSRLCLCSPTPIQARLLALVFQLYHHTKSVAKEQGGAHTLGSRHVQRIAFESARTFVNHV